MRKLKIDELNRLSVEEFKKAKKVRISVILDNVRSLNNIGSIFRTCDAFLIDKLYLCGITACPPHKDIHKTALGATESIDWEYYDDTLIIVQKLKDLNYSIISAEQTEKSIPLQNVRLDKEKKYAIIFGHEVRGIDQSVVNISDFCIEIPQFGTKHSLNISVSAGIVLWEIFRQLYQEL